MSRYSRGSKNTNIPDGDNQARTSKVDGERFTLGRNDTTTVGGAPVLTYANDRVSFDNRGNASTTGDTSTISIDGDKGRLNNGRGAEIEAEGTGVSITGRHASVLNSGTIAGDVNGVNFVNGGASSGRLTNLGTISSDSRAVNIGGDGVSINNFGKIVGTGDQRNGTIYSDGTAENFSIFNGRRGVIDAGEGNDGAGIALQTGDVDGDVVRANIVNQGEITGRGQAAANVGQAGDGIRIFAGADDVTFRGNIINSGDITSESLQGPTAGVRIANGVNFDGNITNTRSGLIDGANNGLYFGTGDHDANVRNFGTIQSDSRAVNIDGNGIDVTNFGRILGTDDQRNGTIYADSTADDYSITNARRGLVDAGHGNNGSGVSLQTGDVDGDTVSASVSNHGTIVGRGDATEGNTVGDGVRLFSGVDDTTFDGNITNTGRILASRDSDTAVGISIEDGISLDGKIVNRGIIQAIETAIDASEAGGHVVIDNRGRIEGDVELSDGNDLFFGSRGRVDGTIDGGAGDDVIHSGRDNDVLVGGLGNDVLAGGRGRDTASYADADVPVNVDLAAGTATRETGFSVEFEDQSLASLTTAQSPAELVEQAAQNNLYYNIHTNDFNGGEIRGQLLVQSDVTEHGVRTIVLEADLNSAQEPGPQSDSDATGQGRVTIVIDGDDITYSSVLSVTGLAQSDLLPVAGVSAIHLHNAPAGQNGPVITDIVQDAGGDTNGNVTSGAFGDTGDGDVFVEVTETDRLFSIENVIGSNDGDTITGDGGNNILDGAAGDDLLSGAGGNDTLLGGEGDDTLLGGGGTDIIDGGEGIDTNSFANIGSDVNVSLNADGSGTAVYAAPNGNQINETFAGIENITGSANNDTIMASGAAANTILGGDGDDFIAGGGGDDTLDGGAGIDTNSFLGIGADIVADLGNGTASYQPNADTTIFETFSNFENLDGSTGDDILSGDAGGNVLTGNDGNDILSGRGGADTLIGGDGDDTLQGGGGNDALDGGDGIDTADFGDIGVGVEIDLAQGTGDYVVNGNNIRDTISNVENVTGSSNDDIIVGDGGDNLLAGGAGSDVVEGGAGDDYIRGDALGDGEALTVTVTNTLGEGGTFLTPVWFGFHDGANFDLYTRGEASSQGLERLAEDGFTTGISAEFNQQVGDNGVDATLIGPNSVPGPIDPGEAASFSLNVNASVVGQGFFTWGTMIIASNDAFLASPGNPLSNPIFDADGNFLGPITIQRFGSDVLDAGTEVNTEENAAFLNQTAPDQGITENGVVALHEGFNGSEGNPDGGPQDILGGTSAAGTILDQVEADFTRNGGQEQLLEITIDRVAGSNDVLNGGLGNDTIEGGGGDDTLTGGGGEDTFVFINSSRPDLDTVTDFENGQDRFDVSEFGFVDFGEIGVEQVGDSTLLTFAQDQQALLVNVDADQIDEQDFILG